MENRMLECETAEPGKYEGRRWRWETGRIDARDEVGGDLRTPHHPNEVVRFIPRLWGERGAGRAGGTLGALRVHTTDRTAERVSRRPVARFTVEGGLEACRPRRRESLTIRARPQVMPRPRRIPPLTVSSHT